MGNFFDGSGTPRPAATQPLSDPTPDSDLSPIKPQAETDPGVDFPSDPVDVPAELTESSAETRFKSCRWYESEDGGLSYCSNRDVLPFAGKNGFSSSAWCPECTLYKVKRTTKKRPIDDYDY